MAAALSFPARKPMARARRVSLFEREIRVGLSSAAIDILFERASVLSEGQVEGGGYFGSTMITLDCARARDLVAEACDASTVKKLGELLLGDERFRERARYVGEREARRLAEVPLEAVQIDLRVRAAGNHLHVDLDVEATPSRQARAL